MQVAEERRKRELKKNEGRDNYEEKVHREKDGRQVRIEAKMGKRR
jgi:hypothetical protein